MKHIFYIMGVTGTGRHTLSSCLVNEIPSLKVLTYISEKIEDKEQIVQLTTTLWSEPLEDKIVTNETGETCYFRVIKADKDSDNFIVIGDLNGYMTMKTAFEDRLIPVYIKADYKDVLQRMLSKIEISNDLEKYSKQFVMETEKYRQCNLEAARIKKGFYCKPGVYGFYELLYDVRKYMQMIISRDGGMED